MVESEFRSPNSGVVKKIGISFSFIALAGLFVVYLTLLRQSTHRTFDRSEYVAHNKLEHISEKNVILQVGASDCGPAAVANVLLELGLPAGLTQLVDEVDPAIAGSTFEDLERALTRRGVRTSLNMHLADKSLGSRDAITLRNNHFIVIPKQRRSSVIIVIDPLVGRAQMPLASFTQGWTHQALEVISL